MGTLGCYTIGITYENILKLNYKTSTQLLDVYSPKALKLCISQPESLTFMSVDIISDSVWLSQSSQVYTFRRFSKVSLELKFNFLTIAIAALHYHSSWPVPSQNQIPGLYGGQNQSSIYIWNIYIFIHEIFSQCNGELASKNVAVASKFQNMFYRHPFIRSQR